MHCTLEKPSRETAFSGSDGPDEASLWKKELIFTCSHRIDKLSAQSALIHQYCTILHLSLEPLLQHALALPSLLHTLGIGRHHDDRVGERQTLHDVFHLVLRGRNRLERHRVVEETTQS